MLRLTQKVNTRGFSLIEVMIAIAILAIMIFSMISSMVFSARATRFNTNSIAAKNVAQGYFERMAIDTFANVGPAQYPDVDYDSDPGVWLDEGLGIRCRVQFAFKGFGTAEAGSATSISDNNAAWEPGEWQGDTLYIVAGRGAGQSARISGNTGTTLTVESNLAISPNSTSRYMINNGKTVEVTTSWQYMGREYSQTIESLVINNRGDSNLGF